MQRKNAAPTFTDAAVAGLGGPRTERFLQICRELIPWKKLEEAVSPIFPEHEKGGRPFWPALVMIKCVLLQKWFGLSDPQLEEQLRDRLSFRRFVGLSLDDATPDETTLVNFRNPYSNSWDGATANVPAYVRRTSESDFTVFAINCAHLGCPVRWFKESQLFMCPCHGGVYYADGSRASGPPERGLFTYGVKVMGESLMIDAGQMPTLSNQASLDGPCSGGKWPTERAEDALANIVKTIAPYKPNQG